MGEEFAPGGRSGVNRFIAAHRPTEPDRMDADKQGVS